MYDLEVSKEMIYLRYSCFMWLGFNFTQQYFSSVVVNVVVSFIGGAILEYPSQVADKFYFDALHEIFLVISLYRKHLIEEQTFY